MTTNTLVAPIAIIRLAMGAGVVLFGAVAWFIHQQAGWTPSTALPVVLRYVQVAISVAAVMFAFVLRGRVAAETNESKRNSLLIMGWAVGEGAALVGAVIFFLTPEWQWYALGLVAMFASFRLLPIRQ